MEMEQAFKNGYLAGLAHVQEWLFTTYGNAVARQMDYSDETNQNAEEIFGAVSELQKLTVGISGALHLAATSEANLESNIFWQYRDAVLAQGAEIGKTNSEEGLAYIEKRINPKQLGLKEFFSEVTTRLVEKAVKIEADEFTEALSGLSAEPEYAKIIDALCIMGIELKNTRNTNQDLQKELEILVTQLVDTVNILDHIKNTAGEWLANYPQELELPLPERLIAFIERCAKRMEALDQRAELDSQAVELWGKAAQLMNDGLLDQPENNLEAPLLQRFSTLLIRLLNSAPVSAPPIEQIEQKEAVRAYGIYLVINEEYAKGYREHIKAVEYVDIGIDSDKYGEIELSFEEFLARVFIDRDKW